MNQGGGIADVRPFLKANYGEQWREINQKLNELAVTLPYKIEELRGTHIMSLGMDIGIDKDGELYIFEVNDGPATSAIRGEVAYLRSSYYKFILQEKLELFKETQIVESEEFDKILKDRRHFINKNKRKSKQLRSLKREIQQLQKNYNKEYDKFKSSTSWRITAPIRRIGSLAKKLKKE